MISTTSVSPTIVNRFDTATGERGTVLISAGALAADVCRSAGLVTVSAGATFSTATQLVNAFHGELTGEGLVDVSAAGHMVAGDSNEAFTDAVSGFLSTLPD